MTPAKLRQIDAAEAALKRFGFDVCRVRHHGSVARIEVPLDALARLQSDEIWSAVSAAIRAVGFDRVETDARGFKSGRLNETLPRPA